MKTWHGDILIDDGPVPRVRDLCIWGSVSCQIPPNKPLRFLTYIHTPSIPLYLIAGSSSEVSTSNEKTSAWLSQSLLDPRVLVSESDAARGGGQSHNRCRFDCGILLQVEPCLAGSYATEVLLYAALPQQSLSLPPATRPSSLAGGNGSEKSRACDPSTLVKVYALPLCSRNINDAKAALETHPHDVSLPEAPTKFEVARREETQKRRKLDDIFDDATRNRRRLRGQDGESVSKAVAGASVVLQEGPDGVLEPTRRLETTIEHPNNRKRSLHKSSSSGAGIEAGRIELASECALAGHKRSSLRRVESAYSPREGSAVTESESGIWQQNKSNLVKIIMAGMRLHGFQQRKKPVQLDTQMTLEDGPIAANDPASQAADDEYKAIYHQTYKAATFALRAHFSDRQLGNEVLRDVVDRLLDLFCTAPANAQYDKAYFAGPLSRSFEAPSMNTSGNIMNNCRPDIPEQSNLTT